MKQPDFKFYKKTIKEYLINSGHKEAIKRIDSDIKGTMGILKEKIKKNPKQHEKEQ